VVLNTWSRSEHPRAVLAQCEVAIEHYRGILALVSQKLGLPAESLARNLFELSICTIYLAKHPELLDDFIDFGTNIHYEVLAAMSPALLARDKSLLNELEMREFEHDRMVAYFGKKSWHRRSVRELADDTGFGPLYRTFYKVSSSIAHGDSFILLRRRHLRWWTSEVNRKRWASYVETSARFAYLLMATLFEQVNLVLALGHDQPMHEMETYIATHPEYEIPTDLR